MTAEPLSPTTAAILLIDHQTGVLERVVKAPPREAVEANVLRLARAAAVLDMPLIFTTSEEDGQNGALLPSLQQVLPAAYASRIDRHGIIDSLADPAVAQAVSATGRRQLITRGIGTEVCGLPPALHARRDGYQVAFVADACGSLTAIGHDISLRRLEREGITLTTHRHGHRRTHRRLPPVLQDHARRDRRRAPMTRAKPLDPRRHQAVSRPGRDQRSGYREEQLGGLRRSRVGHEHHLHPPGRRCPRS